MFWGPKSVSNRCVIEVFDGVFVLSFSFLEFSFVVKAFVIERSQNSSFFSCTSYVQFIANLPKLCTAY